MADILRVPKLRAGLGPFPALAAYTDRILSRPAFLKAHKDQLDHFAAADAARAN
jgi:glutathione S-transferase